MVWASDRRHQLEQATSCGVSSEQVGDFCPTGEPQIFWSPAVSFKGNDIFEMNEDRLLIKHDSFSGLGVER